MPWGDYGDMLLTGMVTRPDAEGHRGIERTGPFVPPITVAGISTRIVTESFRGELEASSLRGIDFRPTVLKRIVRLDWRSWDLTAEDPEKYPAGGEPENYVLGRKHQPEIATQVGPLWEAAVVGLLDEPGEADFVRTAPTEFSHVLVSEDARTWLEATAAEWVTFEEHRS